MALDVGVVCDRCENHLGDGRRTYQIVVARAVARIQRLMALVSPGLMNSGRLFTIKGDDYKKEIDELGEKDTCYRVYKPDPVWLRYSNYLKDKYVIDVEK